VSQYPATRRYPDRPISQPAAPVLLASVLLIPAGQSNLLDNVSDRCAEPAPYVLPRGACFLGTMPRTDPRGWLYPTGHQIHSDRSLFEQGDQPIHPRWLVVAASRLILNRRSTQNCPCRDDVPIEPCITSLVAVLLCRRPLASWEMPDSKLQSIVISHAGNQRPPRRLSSRYATSEHLPNQDLTPVALSDAKTEDVFFLRRVPAE